MDKKRNIDHLLFIICSAHQDKFNNLQHHSLQMMLNEKIEFRRDSAN